MARKIFAEIAQLRYYNWAQIRDSRPMNILYCITGLAIVASPILFLIFKD